MATFTMELYKVIDSLDATPEHEEEIPEKIIIETNDFVTDWGGSGDEFQSTIAKEFSGFEIGKSYTIRAKAVRNVEPVTVAVTQIGVLTVGFGDPIYLVGYPMENSTTFIATAVNHAIQLRVSRETSGDPVLAIWSDLTVTRDTYTETVPSNTAALFGNYPIFDEAYREQLNAKIVAHFHNQEIGQETVELFTFAMKRKMNEIMPFYNQLYESEKLVFDPLSTVDIRTLSTGVSEQIADGTSATETNTTAEGKSRAVQSATPQVALSGNGDYATGLADSNSQNSSDASATEVSSSTNNATQDSDSRTSGYQGHTAALLMAFRQSFLNIDLMVISECDELFMLIWNTSDEYTTTKGWYGW